LQRKYLEGKAMLRVACPDRPRKRGLFIKPTLKRTTLNWKRLLLPMYLAPLLLNPIKQIKYLTLKGLQRWSLSLITFKKLLIT
jgi:hypothetical protein